VAACSSARNFGEVLQPSERLPPQKMWASTSQ
jgi:hypothetical protein